ncbi:hypothetical protein Nepgr_003475 [Nepenthes gracilis]|uniref:RNase H type-1 domain-containing protein n=1 Tax=Nepenthes gracilis TaxID=150966 RepID=A0AAD3XDY9_NEPGR|nr:hypothetical protein Nepgr_003475 [Nepenthes gracilis]
MSCLFQLSSYSVSVLSKAARFIATSSFYGCSIPSRERTFNYSGVGTINLESVFARFHIHCYSSKSTRSRRSAQPKMEEQKDPFFVVRKGDIVGVYKTLSECQAQVGMSVLDPPVSVYKGYSLPKDTKEYLVSHGLQNALYTIKAADLKVDLFGELVPCALQEPMPSKGETSSRDLLHKRPHEVLGSEILEPVGSTSIPIDAMGKHTKLDLRSTDTHSCILEFDGASRGNPGQAGAGAVLRSNDGSLICKLRQGLGIATNNAAEYRAVILGLKYALEKGYTSIRVRGDSKLVCMQLQGLWKVRHQNMCDLYAEAKKLKDKFFFFQIGHVLREFNSDADAQANLAVSLADGQVQEDLLYN